jgi:hypothetical protein
MNQYKKITLLLIVLSAGYLFFHTQKYKNYMKLATFSDFSIDTMDCKDTLILFDIDEVVISSPKTLDYSWWFLARLFWQYPHYRDTKEFERLDSILWLQWPLALIEPEVVTLIHDLRARGCIVMGLTAMESGAFGIIPSMPVWRYEMLSSMGITFTSDFGNTAFTDLTPYRGDYPVLYEGILCANNQDKGEVLQAFLLWSGFQPKKVIFFDDLVVNLESVDRLCKKLSLPAELYYYTGAERLGRLFDAEHVLLHIRNNIDTSLRAK